jgi:hypothetical protein
MNTYDGNRKRRIDEATPAACAVGMQGSWTDCVSAGESDSDISRGVGPEAWTDGRTDGRTDGQRERDSATPRAEFSLPVALRVPSSPSSALFVWRVCVPWEEAGTSG